MKIDFISVSWKNFLSYGNNVTKLNLNENKTTALVGLNGSGKSTVTDVICFNLFGRPFREINKPNIINSINNKDLLTEIILKKGNIEYKIIRGMKPNIFEIWKNDKLVNQTSNEEYQEYLEKEIGLNLKIFKQMIVIGKASYTPFMQLKTPARRDMIEDLLDIKVFSNMNVILKEKISINKQEINDIDLKIGYVNQSIEAIEKISKEYKENNNKEIEKLKESIIDIKKTIDKLIDDNKILQSNNEKLKPKTIKKEKIEENIIKITDKEKETETIKSLLEKEISFFDKHKDCPTCKQQIDPSFKKEILKNKQEEIDKHNETLDKLETLFIEKQNKLKDINIILKLIDETERKIKINQNEILSFEKTIKIYEKSIKDLENKIKKPNNDTKKLKEELKELDKQKSELVHKKEHYEIIGSLLKDGGIKTKIIKQYIPVMNKLINKYLASMDFFVNFEIDEQFNETIKSRFRDNYSYNSFSEGEKLRIDLAILFTWRAIAKMKNNINTNLLFLDEMFESSLDDNGIEEFLKILNGLTDGTNTFIVSHKSDQLFDKFEKIYKFEKVQSFSRII